MYGFQLKLRCCINLENSKTGMKHARHAVIFIKVMAKLLSILPPQQNSLAEVV